MPKKKEELKEEIVEEELEQEVEEAPLGSELEEEEEPEAKVGNEEEKKADDTPEEPPKFVLSEELSPEEEAGKDGKIDIIHNGQVYSFTKEKIVELAQKGFDYDFKVGPHGKIAQMIEADPNLSRVVDDYWQEKADAGGEKDKEFEVSSVDDYDNEEAWLQDNVRKAISSIAKATQPAPQPQVEPQGGTMADALRMRDPEFFNQVYPKLDGYAEQLTMSEYRKVDSDMAALCQFYDFVKEQEQGKARKPKEVKTPGFRVKSGGGEAPKASNITPAWKLSREDFQKQLDKVKGYF